MLFDLINKYVKLFGGKGIPFFGFLVPSCFIGRENAFGQNGECRFHSYNIRCFPIPNGNLKEYGLFESKCHCW